MKLAHHHVEDFKESRLESICPRSLNDELKVVCSFRTWALEAGYPLPTFKIRKLPVRGSGRVKFWTLEQLQSIFTATKEVYRNYLQ